MNIELKLTLEELNAILSMLGELPTKTGAFPLIMKMKEQAEACLKSQQEADGPPRVARSVGSKT
jgi:hypothetical protein